MHLTFRRTLCASLCDAKSWEPVPLLKFHMAPRLRLLMSSGSKKKEPQYACLSEARAYALTQNVG